MTTTKKKKSAREKRVLVASIICAGLIVAGSTFAWFTSQDEVTNRLSANGSYNVAISETFTPPKDLVPGQEVEKDVMAINTGNIPALVRMGVTNHLSGNIIGSAAYSTGANAPTFVQLGDYNFDYALGKNGKTDSTKVAYDSRNVASFYNELADVMTGGWLVYTPTGTSPSTPVIFSDPAGTTGETITINTQVANIYNNDTKPSTIPGDIANPAVAVESGWVLNTDAPTGYYIFRRQIGKDGTDESKDFAYSGFYYAGNDTYYRLTMQSGTDELSNYTELPDSNKPGDMKNSIDGISVELTTPTGVVSEPTTKLQTLVSLDTNNTTTAKTYTVLHSSTGTAADDEILYVVDVNGDDTPDELNSILVGNSVTTLNGNLTDDLIFHLKLAENLQETSSGSNIWTSEHWTAVLDNKLSGNSAAGLATIGTGKQSLAYVYYNDKLNPGETTAKLVDYVTFDERCTGGYANFDFDIDVLLDSIQITYDANGNEIAPGGGAVSTSGSLNSSVAANVGGWGVNATVYVDKTTNGEIQDSNGTTGTVGTTGVTWAKES